MSWKHKTIGFVAALLGVDLEETFRTVETDWKDPLEELHDLPDEDGRIYCWELETDEAARQFSNMLGKEFEKRGRSPDAIHFVITDEEQLRELDREQVNHQVQPFDGGAR